MNNTDTQNIWKQFAASTLSLIAACGLVIGSAADAEAGNNRKLDTELTLFVGNSFIKSAKSDYLKIAKSDGKRVKISQIVRNGGTLEKTCGHKSFEKKVAKKEWDTVFIQEHSKGIWGDIYWGDRYVDMRHCVATIKKHSPNANIVLFMTWRDEDMIPVATDSLIGAPGEKEGYVPIAHELGVGVAPIGAVVRELLVNHYPSINFWSKDGHHAGKKNGAWIVASTMYASAKLQTLASMEKLYLNKALTQLERDKVPALIDQVIFSDLELWNLGQQQGRGANETDVARWWWRVASCPPARPDTLGSSPRSIPNRGLAGPANPGER